MSKKLEDIKPGDFITIREPGYLAIRKVKRLSHTRIIVDDNYTTSGNPYERAFLKKNGRQVNAGNYSKTLISPTTDSDRAELLLLIEASKLRELLLSAKNISYKTKNTKIISELSASIQAFIDGAKND